MDIDIKAAFDVRRCEVHGGEDTSVNVMTRINTFDTPVLWRCDMDT